MFKCFSCSLKWLPHTHTHTNTGFTKELVHCSWSQPGKGDIASQRHLLPAFQSSCTCRIGDWLCPAHTLLSGTQSPQASSVEFLYFSCINMIAEVIVSSLYHAMAKMQLKMIIASHACARTTLTHLNEKWIKCDVYTSISSAGINQLHHINCHFWTANVNYLCSLIQC